MQSKPTYFKKAFFLGALLSCSFADSVTVPLQTYVQSTTTSFGPTSTTQASSGTQNTGIFTSLPASSTGNTASTQSAPGAGSSSSGPTSSVSQNNGNRQNNGTGRNNGQQQTNGSQNPSFGGNNDRRDGFPPMNGNNSGSNGSTNAPPMNAPQFNSTSTNN